MTSNRTRNSESGMALILVITILAALLAMGAITLSLQLNSTKSTTQTLRSREAMYCAEAGLAAARNILVSNSSSWPVLLDTDTTNNPVWYPIEGDIDTDGVIDYQVTIRDDGDDTDPTTDSNTTIIVSSSCIKFPNAPASVIEVISLQSSGHSYRNQSGQGAGNTGNAN